MTRKAVLLALLCLLAAPAGGASRNPASSQVYQGPWYPVLLTHEKIRVDNSRSYPLPDFPLPIPSHTRPIPRLPASTPLVVQNPSSMPSIQATKDWLRAQLSPAEYLCLVSIISHENGRWDPTRWNTSGSGAYGIPQALPGSKMAWAGSDWRTNRITQVKWMIHYVNARYGSACGAWAFWQGHHWY